MPALRWIFLASLIVTATFGAGGGAAAQTEGSLSPAARPKPPTIARHADVRAEATSARGAVVVYRPAKVRGATSVKYSPRSGALFPLGTTVVRITAKNAAGVARSTFKVIIADTTPPSLSPVNDVSVSASDSSGANATYPPVTATDAVDGDVPVSCNPPSGSLFPIGQTRVECSARDRAGNAATTTFVVTVAAPTARPGHYCGLTVQDGKSICFDVTSDGRGIAHLRTEVVSDCGSSDYYYVITVPFATTVPIASDRSFSYDWTSGGLAGSSIRGSFDTDGHASGKLHVHAVFDHDGTHYDCSTETVDWTARLGG